MVLSININKSVRNTCAGNNGTLKEVNGVNGSPISIAPGFPYLEDQFNQMGFKHIRLHDTLGIADLDDYAQANRTTASNQLLPNVPTKLQQSAILLLQNLSIKELFSLMPQLVCALMTLT